MLWKRIGTALWCVLIVGCFLATRSFLTAVFLLGTIVMAFFCVVSVRKSRSTLQISIDAPAVIGKNKKKSIKCVMKNTGAFPIFKIEGVIVCKNELTGESEEAPFVCGLKAYMESKVPIKINSAYCGRIEVSIRKATVYDLTGLLSYQVPVEGLVAYSCVLPSLSDSALSENGQTEDSVGRKSTEEPFGVKEYTPGDPINQIHWKLSEKLDVLLVREREAKGGSGTLLFLETSVTGAQPELPLEADHRMELLVGAVRRLLTMGRHCLVVFWNETVGEWIRLELGGMEELSDAMGTLLSVPFVCDTPSPALARFIEEQSAQEQVPMVYIAGTQVGEWSDEEWITPLYWTE